MGTSMMLNRRTGRYVLDCADCGQADGTVRKRRCPVRTDDGLPYCPAAQLCATDYAAERADGRWAEAHAACPAGVARSNAERAERAAHPDLYARSAVGDWHADVPAGMVQVTTYAGTVVLVPADDYRSNVAGFGTVRS